MVLLPSFAEVMRDLKITKAHQVPDSWQAFRNGKGDYEKAGLI